MEPRSSSTPSNIGRFRVDALLGAGGMGEVYKAFDPTLKRTVAVKTVRPDIDRPDYLERLYREAQACARLQHPNIVTVYEAGEIDGVVYIAMEYLKGEDLAAILRRRDLSFEEKIRILIQILDALQHAHNEDVIHRDIKPSNVYRTLDGSVKLVDFGLARVMRAETLTLSGAVLGTPHYASPEQLKGETVDRRSDIYSVGALAFEMFAGRRPFQTDFDSVATIVLKVISEPTPPMDVSWSRAFPEIERIVDRAMAKSPDERYQSADQMRNELSTFLAVSRDAIATEEALASGIAQQKVEEAKTLIASGLREDAQTLLIGSLRDNPDAFPVRELLESTRLGTPSSISLAPLPPQPDEPELEPEPLAATSEAAPEQVVAAPPVAGAMETQYLKMPSGETTTARQGSRGTWWSVGAAAAVVVLIGVAVMLSQQTVTTVDPAPPVTDATPPSPTPATDAPKDIPTPIVPAPVGVAPTTGSPTSGQTPTRQTAASAPAVSGVAAASGGASAASVVPPSLPAPVKPVVLAPVPVELTAKQMFYDGKGAATANAGLRYRLIQQSPDAGETDVDPSKTFKSGDRVRFAFESNIDGYLYVVQQGSSGRWTVLFPNPDINGGRNQIKKFEQYQVPDGAWFSFDQTPGTEQVFVFLSKEVVGVLPGFDRPVTKMESVRASIVEDLQKSIRSRDLVFERERPAPGAKPSQSTFVVNREEVGKAVAAVIQLVHGQ